jgi:hypothetical protein
LQTEFDLLLQNSLVENFRAGLPGGAYQQMLEALFERRISPLQAVAQLINDAR